ncbi:hypothetical protein BD779DRAFT_1668587 [Infundibulicybe gibba]|nr:hypothetical protein BD779DRAFT_1668587 [Infundibulicybe gibba]
MSFLQRPSPPLLTLSICLETPPDPDDDFFIGCLDCLPSLAVLHINTTIENNTLVSDNLIRRLNIEYPGFVAPNPEKLALGGPVMFPSESFLASRRRFSTARACSAIDHERISRRLAGAPNQESIIDLYF